MKKNDEVLKQRAIYIQSKINKSKDAEKAIKNIASRLFLSESTVLKDLKK